MPSSNIDKRIVEMDFDNQRFERNVNQSISTLDKLKNALNLNDAAKGFNQLEKQANSVNFSGLERSISNIEHRFSALGIAGATIVNNLTNKAIGAVSKLNNAIFGQMKSGGINRALNLEHANFMMQGLLKDANKVAQIMASDGPVQKSVKGTAYGLDEAAGAAAQFLASGVQDLGKLENALTGISGVAAMTGSSFSDIASIFTTVAGQGKVMTMQLRQLEARSLNPAATLAEQLHKSEAEIRDMVTKGKIDFETFAEAMNSAFGDQAKKANETFTGAMSNVKAALSRIGAKVAAPTIENLRVIFVKLITVIDNTSKTLQPLIDFINNVIFSISEAIALFLDKTSNIDAIVRNVVQTIGHAIKLVYSFILPIKRALEDFIPPSTFEGIEKLTVKINAFVRTLILGADQMMVVRRIFRGVFGVFDIAAQVISALLRVLFPATEGIRGFIKGFSNGAATIGDYIYALSQVLKETDAIYSLFSYLKSKLSPVIGFIGDKIKWLIGILKDFSNTKLSLSNAGGFLSDIANAFKSNAGPLESAGNALKIIFGGIGSAIKEVSPILGAFASVCGKAFSEIGHALETALTGGGFKTLLALVNSSFLVTIGLDIAAFIHHIIGSLSNSLKIIDGIRGLFANLNTHLRVMTMSIKADVIMKIAKAIAVFAGSLFLLSLIDAESLTRSLVAISIMMAELMGLIYLFSKVSKSLSNIGGLLSASVSFAAISVGILVLAGALKTIAGIDSQKIEGALGVITALIVELTAVTLVLGTFGSKVSTGAVGIIAFALSVKILGTAIAQIGALDFGQIMKGLVGITGAVIALSGAALAIGDSNFGIRAGIGILAMAGALKIIGSAIDQIGSLQPEVLSKGLVAIGASLSEIAVFMTVMGDANHLIGTAAAIGILSLALLNITEAISGLGQLSPGQLVTGLVGLAGALIELGVALKVLSTNALGMIGAALAIGLLSISLNALIPIITLFANMDLGQFVMSLGGLALALTILGGAAAIMGSAAPVIFIGAAAIAALGVATLASSAGLAAASIAIGLLASSLETLNSIGWLDLLSSLGKLVVAFTVLGVGTLLLSPLVPAMMGMALALGVFATSCAIAAASVSIAAIGVSLMADALTKFETISWETIAKGLLTLVGAIASLSVAALVLAPVAPIILAIGVGIAGIGAGALMTATALIVFSQALSVLGPQIEAIKNAIEDFSNNAWTYLSQALNAMWNGLLDFGSKLSKFILDIGSWIINGIISLKSEALHSIVDLGASMLKALGVPEDWVNVARDFMHGLITGITEGLINVVNKVKEVGKSMIDGIRDAIDSHSDSKETIAVGQDFDGGLITGVASLKDKVIAKVADVGKGMIDQAKSDANSVVNVWEAVTKVYGKSLEFDVGLKTGRIQSIAGVGYFNKDSGEVKNLIAGVSAARSAIENETQSLTGSGGSGGGGGNTGATKKNTKAKEENAEANEKKTKSIDEESEALNEETEAAAENEEEIRALAEQIEVVTEAYNTSLDTIGRADKFKMVKKQAQVMSDFWSKGLKGDGAWKTVQDVYRAYKAIDNSALTTTKVFKKGVYAYKESGKYLKKYKDTLLTSAKEIEKKVLKTGNALAKVTNGQAKMFYKNGNTVEKMTIRLTKRAKNLGKQFAEARAFATALSQENISEKVLNTEKIEDFVYPLRKIQDLFVSRGSMPQAVQDYLGTIRYKLLELNDSMNMLAKNIDGVGSTWKSNAQNTAYVQDAFLSLAASLYDGSEAANEYATEQARLEFLMEHGLATEEEVAEHRESYISRITKALVEYKNTLQDTLQGSLDVWKMFDTKDEDSKTDFIKTIESQLAGYRQWGDMLMELSKRGLSFDIQKELTEAGVESFGKLKSLLSMTREELALFMVDYQQSQTAAERAANLAVAALANARTQATARAAAKSGKITQKQINESRKAAREIANNNKALARDQAIYHSMTKKQEKDYLKTLTKRQRAEYKNAKKEEKKLQKEREALAAQERARRAEIERIETVAASITSYDSLIDVLHRYANDAGVINKVNEILKDTMDKVNKTFKDTGLSTEQFIFIAHKLGAEGDTLDNFLSSVSSTLDSVAESAVGANKELKSMFDTLQQSTTENRLSTMFKNFASHTAAASQYTTLLKILQQNGLSTEGVDYIIKQWSSDQAGTLDLMRQLVSGGAKEITEFNRYFVRQQQINDKAKAESIKALYESTKNYEQELYNAALARKQNADAKVSKLMTSESARTQEELAAIRYAESELERILSDFTFNERLAKTKTGKSASTSTYVEAIMGTKVENAKKIAALNRLGIEAYGNSFNTYLNYAKKIEQYQEQVNKYRSKGISNLTSQERERYGQLMNSINNAYEAQERMNFSSAAKKQVEYILTLEKRIKYEEEARKAALDMAKAEQANATAAYNDAKARWDKYNAELAAAEQEAALAESYEENYISVTALARGYEQWTEALRKNASTAGVLKKAYERVKDTLGNVKSSVDIARSLFKDWEGISKSPIRELTIIEEGFLRLANAMSEGEKSAEEFTEAATQALKDYRNTLYDNIKGSISIFEEFTKATNKQAKSASTYLDNIQSNMNAIKEWNDAMVTLSKRGVSTEWLKMFAAEGVNSYEKVMAFVQATDKQIGELNQDMVDYQKYLETTTDTTLAAIASSMTDSAISVQEAMIRVFTSEGADRFKQAGYDSSMMIITGLKNGLTNAMPEIVESISESTSSSSVANTLGREVGQAINQGLVAAVSNSVSETVNAAIEKFKMAVDSVNSYAQEYLQQDYTVRIHVDASEMDAAVARMNTAIYGINANAISTSGVVSTSMANQNASNANSGAVATSAVTNNITYNQTNNSPKALSRTEIYRQTRNQLSTIESVVSSATG